MMNETCPIDYGSAAVILDKLQKIREFDGEPGRFWSQYLAMLGDWCDAEAGLIAIAADGGGTPWRYLAFYPEGDFLGAVAATLQEKLPELSGKPPDDGGIFYQGDDYSIIGIECGGNSIRRCLVLMYIDNRDEAAVREMLSTLKTMDDLPELYRIRKSFIEAMSRQDLLAGVLDLMTLMNEHEKFLAAAMTFCNELAVRHRCGRVSLGWHEQGYVHIKAMSHVDTFDKKMDTIQKLELAMEESFDQNIEIVHPYTGNVMIITRDHENYARFQDVAYLCTIPLRIENNPVALCTLERNTAAFGEAEMRLLRLSSDHAVRRLDDLKKNDLWFGKLIVRKIKKRLAGLIGFEHTWAKAIGIVVSLALCFFCFVSIPYRLESTAILRTDNVSFLTAPFDGHIEEASKRIGDEIRSGNEILSLERSDLLLQQAELEAEKIRYAREAEKAEASGALADMLIAQALRDQTAARLEIVLDKMEKATMHAPFDGVIVEGDLTERIGSPVKQGDVLYKIARLEGLYAELDVRESEIHNALNTKQGELALASRPQEKQAIVVDRLEPAAVVKKEGNVFVVRCTIRGKIPQWWRPGMTGVAKLDAGRRTPLWIITHRTVDFLRLKLWW
ncbi:MAG: efflux RND transporter periplasmic adaptor subunit [Chitinispirillaceae bacterium]|nr:efflux RND transporter periplasmic adaptor subunit [Chitinispirillaceae bacterium]